MKEAVLRGLIFLLGVWLGSMMVAMLDRTPRQPRCCCGGSGSGPAPAGEVNLDTRGNLGGGGGYAGAAPPGGSVTFGTRPTPKSTSAPEAKP